VVLLHRGARRARHQTCPFRWRWILRQPAGAPELGINELVKILYPSIFVPYEELHQRSIQVPYQAGLLLPITILAEDLALIQQAVDGGLKAS
jgi:hypothetical protein